jgi:hypothetical protein
LIRGGWGNWKAEEGLGADIGLKNTKNKAIPSRILELTNRKQKPVHNGAMYAKWYVLHDAVHEKAYFILNHYSPFFISITLLACRIEWKCNIFH